MNSRVKILDPKEDLADTIGNAVEDLGGLDLTRCKRIVILPTLDSPHKSEQSGSIVRREVVEGIVRFIREKFKDNQITIVCGAPDADSVFQELGYQELAEKYDNLKLLNLNSCEKVKVLPSDSKIFGPFEFPQELILADALISVATVRRHVHERLAGVWSNPFSTITNIYLKLKVQSHLSKALYDLNLLAWPSLCIVDAKYALEGTGPVEGRPKYIGKFLVGFNPVAMDIALAKLVGVSPKSVPHLKYAMKQLKIKEANVQLEGNYCPTELDFITNNQFRLWRIGLFLKRLAKRLEQFGNLTLYFSLALASVGIKDLSTGRWVSLKDSLSFAKDIYSKIYDMETLLDRKIIINRHVKEQSVS